MVGSPLLEQGTPMSNLVARLFSRIFKSKHPSRYLVWVGLFLLPGGSIVYLSRSSKCIVIDGGANSPSEMVYRDFTIPRACNKALAMCSYLSREPKKCLVKK